MKHSHTIGPALRDLRDQKGYSLRDMEKLTGISFAAIGQKERGGSKITNHDVERFAIAFGLTVTELLWVCREMMGSKSVVTRGIPLINQSPSGSIINYEEHDVGSDSYAEEDWGGIADPKAYCLQFVGDSMEPAIRDGDCLVFAGSDPDKSRTSVADGKVVFVKFADASIYKGCFIARWFQEPHGKVRLSKDNPKYSARIVAREYIFQVGTCLERRTRAV